MCDGWIHLKCTVIGTLKFHTLCSSTEPHLRQNCYSEMFPFQTLDDKQLLNEMRNDDKLNFDINHKNNSFFSAKCLQVDNKIKSIQCKVKWVPFLPQRHNYKLGRSRIVY